MSFGSKVMIFWLGADNPLEAVILDGHTVVVPRPRDVLRNRLADVVIAVGMPLVFAQELFQGGHRHFDTSAPVIIAAIPEPMLPEEVEDVRVVPAIERAVFCQFFFVHPVCANTHNSEE